MKPRNNASRTIEQVLSLVHLVSVLVDRDTNSTFTMKIQLSAGSVDH